ncbi:hypothetical protein ACFLRM_01210 [Acidobacteriota bacterium]
MDELKFHTLAGIFFLSSAILCFEISLTRYFSVSQYYHFAFLVVSIAFMGFGASGSFLCFLKKAQTREAEKFLPISSLLFSLTILFSFFLCNSIPFDFMNLTWDNTQILYIFLYYSILSIPFFFAGITLSFIIAKAPKVITKIYFFDLLGAGAGTVLAIFVFLPKGDKGVIVFISFLALLSCFFFSFNKKPLFKLVLLCLIAAEAALFFYSPLWLSFRISPFKALPIALRYPKAKPLLTKWNSKARVDVLESPAVRYAPGLSLLYDKMLPDQLGLSVDGDELTAITQFKHREEPALKFLSFLPSSVAYSFVQNPDVLIIEPKAGLDVLAAFVFKASQIHIIESNPLIVNLVKNELADFCGDFYNHEKVNVTLADTRAALKKGGKKYDLIVFSLTDVFGSAGTGLQGFGENYIYTLESFTSLLNRLSPGGLISMSQYLLPPPRQEVRALATWIEALEKSRKNPSDHLAVIRSWGTISYFIKIDPFTAKDIQKLKDFASTRYFDLVFYPGINKEETNIYNKFDTPIYYDYTTKLISLSTRQKIYKNYLFQVSPVNDNRPFFYNFFKLTRIKSTYKAFSQKWLPLLKGKFLVLLLLVQSIIVAFILIILPLFVLRDIKTKKSSLFPKVFLYFSLIGMAFMFVEITFIQKFVHFLGHPLYSISAIIGSLLVSSGIGSYFSRKILGENLEKNLKISLVICAGLIIFYLFLLPFFYNAFIGFNLVFKISLTFAIVFPLGVLLGFPFPSGIRLLSIAEKKLIPWAWAANAFSSVINSILALMIAFWGGYNFVMILASGGYLFALVFLGFPYHGNKTNT